MGSVLDIVYSLAIRGVIVAMVIGLTFTMRDALYNKTSVASTTQILTTAAQTMERDIELMGYNVVGVPILLAQNNEVTFLSDIYNNNDGSFETVDYQLIPDASVPGAIPPIYILQRTVNGSNPLQAGRGPISLNISYFDSLGAQTSVLGNIRSLGIVLTGQIDYQLANGDSIVTKQFHVYPSNL